MSKNQKSAIAIAWYENPVIYRTARSIMSDKASLPVAYIDWRELAVRSCKMNEAAGNRVERVMIMPAVFRDWARSSGHDHDARVGRHLLNGRSTARKAKRKGGQDPLAAPKSP